MPLLKQDVMFKHCEFHLGSKDEASFQKRSLGEEVNGLYRL